MVGLLFSVSAALYTFSLFTTGLETVHETSDCSTFPKWYDLVQHMALLDIIITIIAPMLIIFVVNVLISLKLMNKSSNSNRRQSPPSTSVRCREAEMVNIKLQVGLRLSAAYDEPLNMTLSDNSKKKKNKSPNISLSVESRPLSDANEINQLKTLRVASREISRCSYDALSICEKSKIKRMKAYSKTTRMLLIISTIFFFLNVPMAFSKLRYLVTNLIAVAPPISHLESANALNSYQNATLNTSTVSASGFDSFTQLDQIIERLACYLYYLNYSINFVLYTCSGERFKETMVKFLKRRFQRRQIFFSARV